MPGRELEQSAELPHGFVNDRIRRAREIEAPDFGAHRQAQILRRLRTEDGVGQAARLASEEQDISRLELRVPDVSLAELRDRPPATAGKLREYFVPAVDNFPVEMVPVIHRRSAEVSFVRLKSEWPNEPQLRPDSHARPPNVPGVLRDIGLMQNDVEQGGNCH